MFVKIAVLSIRKHFKRSLVVFGAVTLSVMAMTVITGAIEGMTATLKESLMPQSGHIQWKSAAGRSAANEFDLKYLVPGADDLMAQFSDPRIVNKEKILTFGALLVEPSNGDTTKEVRNLAMIGQGVSPESKFFLKVREGLIKGEFLPEGRGILLSQKVARLLKTDLGQGVVVLTQDTGGNPWYQELPLVGIFQSGNTIQDENTFLVSHKTAEELLDAAGKTSEIRITLKDPEEAEKVVIALTPFVKDHGITGETWKTILGAMLTIVEFINLINLLLNTFFIVVAASVITNSILMTVFERIREHGTLRAIGLKRRQIFRMILTEGLILGLMGSVMGLILGLPLIAYFQINGLDLGSTISYLGMGEKFYFAFSFIRILVAGMSGVLVALAASWYAARTSTKLSVTQSLGNI